MEALIPIGLCIFGYIVYCFAVYEIGNDFWQRKQEDLGIPEEERTTLLQDRKVPAYKPKHIETPPRIHVVAPTRQMVMIWADEQRIDRKRIHHINTSASACSVRDVNVVSLLGPAHWDVPRDHDLLIDELQMRGCKIKTELV